MTDSIRNASNDGARCRSPSQMVQMKTIMRILFVVYMTVNRIIIEMVETARRAYGSSATKFYTGNNRERRRVISAL